MKYFLIVAIFLGCGCSSQSRVGEVAQADTTLIAKADTDILFQSVENSFNNNDRKRLKRQYPKTLEKIEKRKPLSLQDIKNLTRSGISDPEIIEEISKTHSIFYLTPPDEKELEDAGVSNRVIEHMKETSDTHYY